MTFDPLEAVGLVVGYGDQVLGGCFRFRHEHMVFTAKHCVPTSEDLVTFFPRSRRAQRVTRVEGHPTADIALLVTEAQPSDSGSGHPTNAFWDRVSNWRLGEEFMAFGYPVEGPSPEAPAGTPIARLFIGHYQRFFEYSSPSRDNYLVGEMSIPAPAGLSGSPLFRAGAPQMVTGMVTTNLESYAVTDSITEVRDGEKAYREEARKVIAYGLALILSNVSDWLRDVLPERDGLGWVS
jgi:trypsin-like peptidase